MSKGKEKRKEKKKPKQEVSSAVKKG